MSNERSLLQAVTHPSWGARLSAFGLALLLLIAPLWHVCALSGHGPAHAGLDPGGLSHSASEPGYSQSGGYTRGGGTNADGTRRALVCVCAPLETAPHAVIAAPLPEARDAPHCLAMLLATTPIALTPPASLNEPGPTQAQCYEGHQLGLSRPLLLARRGRAPPIG